MTEDRSEVDDELSPNATLRTYGWRSESERERNRARGGTAG